MSASSSSPLSIPSGTEGFSERSALHSVPSGTCRRGGGGDRIVPGSYVFVAGVAVLVAQRGEHEAEVLLVSRQRLVEEPVVALLVAQREGGGQGGQLGRDVGLGRVQLPPAPAPPPQDGAVARLQQLRDRNGEREGIVLGACPSAGFSAEVP